MKQKTVKALAKRFQTNKKGTVLKRRAGQDHFNAKETGQKGRKKRNDLILSETLAKTIRRLT